MLALIAACEASGVEMPTLDFQDGCRRVASLLHLQLDEDIWGHFRMLLAHGDRLAAVLLLVPPEWGYSIERRRSGTCVACKESPFRNDKVTFESDGECAALLGALAASLKLTELCGAQQ